jgi:DNA-binding NtrC family response regulator
MKNENKRILIVDDDKLVLDSFKQSLELEGYVVDTAETGREAIEKSKASFYNLALIDIRLPDMEGTELLTAMRDTTPKMRKLIVTGYPSLSNAVAAVNKDADGYIIKPIMDMNELLNVIKEQLKKQEEARQYSEKKVAEFIESRMKDEETKKN